MRVTVTPGRAIRLDDRRSTSTRGGTYDLSGLSEEDRKRILATPGVKPVEEEVSSAKRKEG